MSERQPIGLFRVARSEVSELVREILKKKKITSDEIVDHIAGVQYGDFVTGQLKFKKDVLVSFAPYRVRGFFETVATKFEWATFFKPNLTENHPVNDRLTDSDKSSHKAFYIFIYNEKYIYCFSGGLGYHYIKEFIDDDFGISMLEKLDLPVDLSLMMLRSRSIVGNVATDQRFFRSTHRTIDENNLGRIYNEVTAKIPFSESMSSLKEMIFDDKINSTKNVKVGQNFKFSKAIELKDLAKLVKFFSRLDKKESLFILSNLKPIKAEKAYGKIKIESLNRKLHVDMFSYLERKINKKSISNAKLLEVTHSNYHQFYESEKVSLTRGKSAIFEFESPYGLTAGDLLDLIFETEKDRLLAVLDEIDLLKDEVEVVSKKIAFISAYKLECSTSEAGNDKISIRGRLLDFITGEILDEDNNPFFLLDSKWYTSKEDFLNQLNASFDVIYKSNSLTFPGPPWDPGETTTKKKIQDENTFLEGLLEASPINTLVMHRVTKTNNMELCDFLTWNKEELYVCHVKPSFDADVRVLVQQISHSSRIIEEELRTGNTTNLTKYFDEAKNYQGNSLYMKNVKAQFANTSLESFLGLFKNKNINYVACVVDTSGRDLKNIADFKSNIAKMSVIEGFRSLRTSAAPSSRFLISQIPLKPRK